MTVNDILGMMKRGDKIPVDDICAATRVTTVARGDLEARLTLGGYFYAIAEDVFMPPKWVAERRAVAAEMLRVHQKAGEFVTACQPIVPAMTEDGGCINECPQAEEIMRKHGYWEEGMK